MVLLYAGNTITGEVIREVVRNDDEQIANAIEGFTRRFGAGNLVYAFFNLSQSLDVRDFQFNNYLARHM